MKRYLVKKRKDSNGKDVAIQQPYNRKSIISVMTLSTGQSSIVPFKKKEAVNEDRNYNSEMNPFDGSLGGEMIALSIELLGPDYGAIVLDTTTEKAILDAYSKIRNSGDLKIKHTDDQIYQETLSSLLPSAPVLLQHGVLGTPTNVVIPASSVFDLSKPNNNKKNGAKIVTFDPFHKILANEDLTIEVTFMGKISVPIELNGYKLMFKILANMLHSKT